MECKCKAQIAYLQYFEVRKKVLSYAFALFFLSILIGFQPLKTAKIDFFREGFQGLRTLAKYKRHVTCL